MPHSGMVYKVCTKIADFVHSRTKDRSKVFSVGKTAGNYI